METYACTERTFARELSPRLLARMFGTICSMGVFFLCLSAHAQDGDNCKDVLSARNYSTEIVDISLATGIYDQHCQGSQAKDSSSKSLGLDAIIKSVPLKFNLGSGSSSERLSHFCKTFSSSYEGNEARYRDASNIASDAAASWLSCMSFAAKGISFKPTILSTQFVIDISRTNASRASVQGVSYDERLLYCSAPNTKAKNQRTKVDESSVKDLSEDFWTITCKRIAQKQDNVEVYPRADISIGTTKGAFLLPIPAEASHPYQWSAEIQSRINNLESRVVELNKSTNARINGISLSETSIERLPDFGCGGEAVSKKSLEFMVGSRDGTSCKVRNINYVRTLGLVVPPEN